MDKYNGTKRIAVLLAGHEETVTIGCSGADVFRLAGHGETCFLKARPLCDNEPFEREAAVLEWLAPQVPVPRVLECGVDGEFEYLLTSAAIGVDATVAMEKMPFRELAAALADGLRRIHSLPIDTCPFDERLDVKLERAERNVNAGRVDENDFDECRRGWSAMQVLAFLRSERPAERDCVFSHGDYCLPNVMLEDGRVSGYIDLAGAGIADRYNDLAIASRSVEHNLGQGYGDVFLECYGIADLDDGLIEYYRAVDELF
ncbi:MAG: aminoglycoside 3'-phosphotransferase [Pseudomonadales bacterium]|nr:aminoglycoside 3'-phosphotransferase [Pseudomonadales bacterium]